MKIRLIYFGLFVLCFAACVVIVKLFNDNLFIRGYIGDMIVILLIYFLISVFYNFKPLTLTIITLVLAFLAEFSQYINLATFLGLQHNTFAQLTIGSVFDPYDLVVYTVGAFLVYIIDTKLVRNYVLKFCSSK
ncbi:MAG: DUF2809 domain-containing protein [Clostridia bacterium]|nr:DUF2809 domain-containing protein [Clostridia bacterium]